MHGMSWSTLFPDVQTDYYNTGCQMSYLQREYHNSKISRYGKIINNVFPLCKGGSGKFWGNWMFYVYI